MRLALTSVPLLCLIGLLSSSSAAPVTELELFPKHFVLHPNEQIRYEAVQRTEGTQPRAVEASWSVKDSKTVRLIDPVGLFQAVKKGRTEVTVRTATSERRFTVEVAGDTQLPLAAVPHSSIDEIVGKDLLFVGHANLDGFDHTAVAKTGIDRLVEDAKRKGWKVVYWVSAERPNWYTEDRNPDYALISEGQEHQMHIEADRVVFAGGGFMWCTLRNAQMTLHEMLKSNGSKPIHFVFPAQAIWETDVWDQGVQHWYPEPMVVLSTLFARRTFDTKKYDEVVVPFLNRMINEFPVLGYPANPPSPPLTELLKDWTIVVRFGTRFERVYRAGDAAKTITIDFEGV